MNRTFRYRLYPTRRQAVALDSYLGYARDLYNAALEHRISAYRHPSRTSVSWVEQSKELTEAKADGYGFQPLEGMKELPRSIETEVLRRLNRAFQGFYRRAKAGAGAKAGFPRFKGASRWQTLSCQYGKGAELKDESSRLYLQGVGQIKIKLHRSIPSEAERKMVRLTRRSGNWYAQVECESVPKELLPKTGKRVGVDAGASAANYLVLSDGVRIKSPAPLRKAEAKVAEQQRRVASKKRGSNRRRASVRVLARAREREANTRRDFHFKTAHRLLSEYDVLYLEELNHKFLSDGPHAKSMRDQAFAQQWQLLLDKAEKAGKDVLLVPSRNTTQTCSSCGHVRAGAQKLTLRQRTYACLAQGCEHTMDRDLNAALNVHRLGESRRGSIARAVPLAPAA